MTDNDKKNWWSLAFLYGVVAALALNALVWWG
jgi:hypothetical protein